MTLDSIESLEMCIETGTYSTNLSEPNGKWKIHHEGTFADYLSMKEGDNIYFFIKRKIYGIGRIKKVQFDCEFLNYIGGDIPEQVNEKEYKKRAPLLINGTPNNRCFCVFEPSPHFFENGIDMDDALNSNPAAFKMLRAMWKVSFIKIDDNENQALIDIILKRNENNLINGDNVFRYDDSEKNKINKNLTKAHRLTSYRILESCADKTQIKHEMAIEAALCDLLIKENNTPFGKWDYVSHQVVASPFKAVDYMDKMDIFGYRFISGYSTVSRYLVIEIKKNVANTDVIEQIMKYVDWIQSEYAYGDYSMIEAYVVAADFSADVIQRRDNECKRYFTKGYRPSTPCIWDAVKLIKYEFDEGKGMNFTEV